MHSGLIGSALVMGSIATFVAGSPALAHDPRLPVFPAGDNAAAFQPIRVAYEAQRWDEAIQATLRLRSRLQPGPTDEIAAFLLGDLYAARAGERETADLRRAIQAFEDARLRYPDGENAIRALWRIGQLYAAMSLSHEAVASFKRVAARHAETPYAVRAQLDLADLYRAWEHWTEADEVYRALRARPLTPADQLRATLGSADMAARLGRIDEAYRLYRSVEEDVREEAAALFRYAETAYRTGRYGQARNLFLAHFNIYPRDPLAPVSYAYVADTLRIEGRMRNAELAYDEILERPAKSLGEKLAALMAAMGKRQRRGCAPIPSESDREPCRAADDPTAQDPVRLARDLAASARTSIHEQPSEPTLRRLVFDIATSLRGYGLFDVALELHHEIVAVLSPSPIRDRLSAILRETASSGVLAYAHAQDDLGVLRLYHGFRSAFTPAVLGGRVGLTIAESHARLGLLAPAIELASPIAANRSRPEAEDALFLLADGYRRRGEFDKARQRFEQFLARYPASSKVPQALARLVETLDRQGRGPDALAHYRTWLGRAARRQDATAIRRVAGTLGDAAYAAGRYATAVRQYQAALAAASTASERSWLHYRLGRSYRALGRRDDSRVMFALAAAEHPDTLLARVAALHVREIQEPP